MSCDDRSFTEQCCHLVFCFNFPSQTDVDDVYKCLEDQLLVIIRLSLLPGQTEHTSYTLQSRAENVPVVAV